MSKELFPWLDSQWRQLLSQYRQQKLPHAILLQGDASSGIEALAAQLARALLCDDLTEQGACGDSAAN